MRSCSSLLTHRSASALGMWLALSALLLSLSGCAALRAAAARNAHVSERTTQHVYAAPLVAVWPEARALLFEMGYTVRDTGEAGGMTLETEWLLEGDKATRFLVQGISVQANMSKVHFTLAVKDPETGAMATERSWEAEWRLIQRIDPASAMQIRAEAEREADAVRAQ